MQSAILWWQIRPSVRHTPVLYRNECTYRKLFPQSDRGMNLVFQALSPLQNSKGNSLSGGVKHMRWENMRFSTEIAIYLGNGTSTAHGYYGTLIGSHRSSNPVFEHWRPWLHLNGRFAKPLVSRLTPVAPASSRDTKWTKTQQM